MEKSLLGNQIIDKEQNNKTEIKIKYSPQKGKNKRTKIFGSNFVNHNKYNCRIIFKDLEYNLMGYFDLEDINEIKLKIYKPLTHLEYLFDQCESLLMIYDLDKLDTSNVTDMSCMFFECKNLLYLSDISNFDTSKVTSMKYMFCGCSSLTFLPNIGKWDMSSVTDISYMFCDCSSLCFLPDINSWNIKNVRGLNNIFNGCLSLAYFPNNEKWKNNILVQNIKPMACINCLQNSMDNFIDNIKNINND